MLWVDRSLSPLFCTPMSHNYSHHPLLQALFVPFDHSNLHSLDLSWPLICKFSSLPLPCWRGKFCHVGACLGIHKGGAKNLVIFAFSGGQTPKIAGKMKCQTKNVVKYR